MASISPPHSPVLLCVGDRDLRMALAALLGSANLRVEMAAHATQAVSAAVAKTPGCIVLVLPLPGAEPEDTLTSIRGLAGASKVPVVLIAPASLFKNTPSGFRRDLDRWLTPTFRPAALQKAVMAATQ